MKNFKINLSDRDEKTLEGIADTFACSESEVIRKGLQLMSLAAALKKQGKALKIEQDGEIKELIL